MVCRSHSGRGRRDQENNILPVSILPSEVYAPRSHSLAIKRHTPSTSFYASYLLPSWILWKYDIGDELGKGAFCRVSKALNKD